MGTLIHSPWQSDNLALDPWALRHSHRGNPTIFFLDSWHPRTITRQSDDVIIGFIASPAQASRQSDDLVPGFMALRQSHHDSLVAFTLAKVSPTLALSSPTISSSIPAFHCRSLAIPYSDHRLGFCEL
ncbi:hypothetical protein AMTR_s00056p00173510 [Amborella trichopoda]|uniref:Uncharacterized protein n=1 Tax=Amborella trichopoda TaxID=13333 RepID=U5CPV2_AMBTC|nr:hypothetical protein AMTR_s00056p00173510 [Amborella trichopoda]